jgi:two-component system chemotaxis response regulator CheY
MVSVLIVDDDVFLHKVLERILSVGGHEVNGHAYNGAEAVEIYSKADPRPEVVLMDHRMPVMNGVTATKEIMRIDSCACVVFISADETVRDEAFDSGALDFLTKPIRSAQLFAAIEKQKKVIFT